MVRNIFYLSEEIELGYNAAGKARKDVEDILNEKYCKAGYMPETGSGIADKLKSCLDLVKRLGAEGVGKNDILFLQFPLPRGYNTVLPVLNRKYRCVYIIHDLEGLRYLNARRSKRDIAYLKKAYQIISHNRFMTEYLADHGIERTRVRDLELFDYLQTEHTSAYNHFTEKGAMCFAGNLDKSGFLENISDFSGGEVINVYGKNERNTRFPKNVIYRGCYDSDQIPGMLKGKFGLVWDGVSCDSCDGLLGNYMRYNNPHKASMYISAGIPLVVWTNSALSEFVEKKNIGITADSLKDAVDKIRSVDKKQYDIMYGNVMKCREKIVRGQMLQRALNSLLLPGE